MADEADDLDAIFEEAARAAGNATDASIARRNSPEGLAKARADIEREIRLGIRNESGEWIIPSEGDDNDA